MNRIDRKFAELKRKGKKGLILFVTAGDPSLKTTERVIPELFAAGADFVEIGVPFSDPLADGPTIQESFTRALKSSVNLDKIFAMLKRVRKKCDEPLIIMSAFNLIHRYGSRRFAASAKKAGVDGVILPDIIPEESGRVTESLNKHGIAQVFLAAPTSGVKRIKKIVSAGSGFVYYISVKGITGSQRPSAGEVRRQVARIKRHSRLPVAIGFGISTPRQAAQMGKLADGVIVGSAVVKLLAQNGSVSGRIKKVVDFTQKLRKAL